MLDQCRKDDPPTAATTYLLAAFGDFSPDWQRLSHLWTKYWLLLKVQIPALNVKHLQWVTRTTYISHEAEWGGRPSWTAAPSAPLWPGGRPAWRGSHSGPLDWSSHGALHWCPAHQQTCPHSHRQTWGTHTHTEFYFVSRNHFYTKWFWLRTDCSLTWVLGHNPLSTSRQTSVSEQRGRVTASSREGTQSVLHWVNIMAVCGWNLQTGSMCLQCTLCSKHLQHLSNCTRWTKTVSPHYITLLN